VGGPQVLPSHIDVAFNEATLFDVALRRDKREIALGFEVLTLPEGAGGSGHASVTLVLEGVTGVVASFRRGRWNDEDAEVVPLTADEIPAVVASFGGQPIYGWEFFDQPEGSWARWQNRLSLEAHWNACRAAHSLRVFQESLQGPARHLDLGFWFERIEVRDVDDRALDLEEFTLGGRRWSDAMIAGDERTKQSGIVPLRPDDPKSP
jgi:hypothetical protein